jgi:NitT/TauT family transport system ATP-binding protein
MFYVEHLSLRCGARVLIDDLTCAVRKYDLCVLMGPSGIGKTTLLKVLVGLHDASIISTQGTVSIDYATVQLQKGYIAQHEKLIPWLTVEENITLPSMLCPHQPLSVSRVEREALYTLLEIRHLLQHSSATVSGGEAQRILLARTILHSDKVLIFDEPWSHLDASLRRRMLPALRSWLRSNGYSALVIVHEPEDALLFSTRVLVLNSFGSLAADLATETQSKSTRSKLYDALFSAAYEDTDAA